jgi:hypothetical protein
MMYVVPVLAVGGWGWWSARRIKNDRKGGGGGDAPKPPLGSTAGSPASH